MLQLVVLQRLFCWKQLAAPVTLVNNARMGSRVCVVVRTRCEWFLADSAEQQGLQVEGLLIGFRLIIAVRDTWWNISRWSRRLILHRFSVVRTFSKFVFVCGTRVRFDGCNERSVLSNETNHVKCTGNFTCYIWVRMLICYSKKTTSLNKDKIVNLNTKRKFKDCWIEVSTHSPTRPQHGSKIVASQKI